MMVKAVRLENFTMVKNWTVGLGQRLWDRYPGAKIVMQSPTVALVFLNTTAEWGQEDEHLFAALKTQAFFQRWEPLTEVPPTGKSNKATYEDIGYRVGEGQALTRKQQESLLSQLHDLELRATMAEEDAKQQRYRAEEAEEHAQTSIDRHNQMVQLLEEIHRLLGINVRGDFVGGPVDVSRNSTGRVLFRDTSLIEVYRALLKK